MKEFVLKDKLKSIVWACVVIIFIGILVFTINIVQGEESALKEIAPGETINLTNELYLINLSEYNVKDRSIERGPNKTGVTIIYDDNTWTYIDEYTNMGQDSINLGTIDISTNHVGKITGIYIAPGYEAILMDNEAEQEKKGENEKYQYKVNGKNAITSKHTTRILGPLNMQGYSPQQYIINSGVNIKERKGLYDTGRVLKISGGNLIVQGIIESGKHKGNIKIDLNADKADIFKLLQEGKDNELQSLILRKFNAEPDSKTDSELGDFVKGKVVKLFKDAYSNFKGNQYKEMSLAGKEREYITIKDYNNKKYLSKVTGEIKESGDSDDIREDVKTYNLTRIQVKKVSQKEGVYLMKGLYNVLNEENRYAKRDGDRKMEGVFEYISPSINIDEGASQITLEKTRNTLKTNGHVNSIMVVGNYEVRISRENKKALGTETDYIKIQGAPGKITDITNFWENEEDGDYQNEISKIQILPRGANSTNNLSWENAYRYYEDGTYSSLNQNKNSNKLSNGVKFIKIYDMADMSDDPVVTAYTKANFKGEYLRFYMGELNNLGNDKEIEEIGSLEVAPNTRVVFFDQEDLNIDLDNVNYENITWKENMSGQNALIVDGPAYISDLQAYFDRVAIDSNGKITYKKMTMKAFYIQYFESEDKGVSLYNYENGVGTFKIFENSLNTNTISRAAINLNQKQSINPNMPESISIRGNYFVKLYNSKGGLEKTIIGPASNHNLTGESLDWLINYKKEARANGTNMQTTAYAKKARQLYDKWTKGQVVISESTQKDEKSRSLENTDGVTFYKNTNYNSGIVSQEDVWTHFSSDDFGITEGTSSTSFSLDLVSKGKNKEVEWDNIGSIRIVGSFAGKYELRIRYLRNGDSSGIVLQKTTRYNVSNMNEFLGLSGGAKLVGAELIEIQNKEMDILLDSSNAKDVVTTDKWEKITTSEEILNKVASGSDSVSEKYSLNNSNKGTVTKEVYMVSLEDVISAIEAKIRTKDSHAKEFARVDYVYKYDAADFTREDLVGVRISRNIGTFPAKSGNTETYTNIDSSINDIAREIEFRLNLSSAIDVLSEKNIVLSDEFSYTTGSRGAVITDHGYLTLLEGQTKELLKQNIRLVDDNVYPLTKTDEGGIIRLALNNDNDYNDEIARLTVNYDSQKGKASARVELIKTEYQNYRFELGESEMTLEGKQVGEEFTLLKDGGELNARLFLNIYKKDTGEKLYENKEYVISLDLPKTNSISRITRVGNTVISKEYKEAMEVPSMLVKRNEEIDQETGQMIVQYVNATQKDEGKILYVPACYKEQGSNSYKTSFLFKQLGMSATLQNESISIHF